MAHFQDVKKRDPGNEVGPSRAVTAKKCTKKCNARAELLFWSKNLLLYIFAEGVCFLRKGNISTCSICARNSFKFLCREPPVFYGRACTIIFTLATVLISTEGACFLRKGLLDLRTQQFVISTEGACFLYGRACTIYARNGFKFLWKAPVFYGRTTFLRKGLLDLRTQQLVISTEGACFLRKSRDFSGRAFSICARNSFKFLRVAPVFYGRATFLRKGLLDLRAQKF